MSKVKKVLPKKVFLEDGVFKRDEKQKNPALNEIEKLYKPPVTFVNDSSDGEDQQRTQSMYSNKSDQSYGGVTLAKIKLISEQYQIPYLLREIGNRILQDSDIRSKYIEIKDSLARILELKEARIKDVKKQSDTFKELNNDIKEIKTLMENRDYYYKKYKDKTLDAKDAYGINKKIIKYSDENRKNLELFNEESISKNASAFFAKLKSQKKYDRDVGKLEVYNFKYGTQKVTNSKAITCKTTQQDETLEISPNGCFSHKITDEGSYITLGARLDEYLNTKKFLDKSQFKNFLILAFKNQINEDVIIDHSKIDELHSELKTIVKLFLLEMQREPASIITIPMFFDLFDKGKHGYGVKDIATKLPMAMEQAVSSSVYLYDKIKHHLTAYSKYDYRDDGEKNKDELSKRENSIFNDWFLQEVGFKLDFTNVTHHELLSLCVYKLIKEWYGLDFEVLAPYISDFLCTEDCKDIKDFHTEELKILIEIWKDNDYCKDIKDLHTEELKILIEIWKDNDLHDSLLNIIECTSLKESIEIYQQDQEVFKLLSHDNIRRLVHEYDVDFDEMKGLANDIEKFSFLVVDNFDLFESTYDFDELLEKYNYYKKVRCGDIAQAIKDQYIRDEGPDISTQDSENESSYDYDLGSSSTLGYVSSYDDFGINV